MLSGNRSQNLEMSTGRPHPHKLKVCSIELRNKRQVIPNSDEAINRINKKVCE
jgi:hypothetical protein